MRDSPTIRREEEHRKEFAHARAKDEITELKIHSNQDSLVEARFVAGFIDVGGSRLIPGPGF